MTETSKSNNPIGLYFHEASNTHVGCIDEIQADAAVRIGYVLTESGHAAAMKTEKEIGAKK